MHPDAVDSLGPEWEAWVRRELGMQFRPWQSHVFRRALEVDSEGRLVWREVVVSAPRQSGKSLLIKALAISRAQHAERFGELQEVIHVGNNLRVARRIMLSSVRWAQDRGLHVRQTGGQEEITWPDGSHWSICSTHAIWGFTASMGIADECWDLEPPVIESALMPTLVEKAQPQLWLVSSANEDPTNLMLKYRRRAMLRESDASLLLEWSAPGDADHLDPEVWVAATPHWSVQRGQLMQASVNTRGFRHQWLNTWPDDATDTHWLVGWAACGSSSGDAAGCVAAVEVSSDRSVYGAAVAVRRGDGSVDVWSRTEPDLPALLVWVEGFDPVVLMAGLSIREQCLGPWLLEGVGLRESRFSTPTVVDLVRRGLLRHDHAAATGEQVRMSRVSQVESGELISAKRSLGPVPTIKAVAWASWRAATAVDLEMPAVL